MVFMAKHKLTICDLILFKSFAFRLRDMGLAERIYSKVFAMSEPKGYYELHKTQYHLPKEVERLEVGNGECKRVTKLNARSFLGVGITLNFFRNTHNIILSF